MSERTQPSIWLCSFYYDLWGDGLNKKRREKLLEAVKILGKALDIVLSVLDDEQDALDNTPENLQNSDAFYHKEETISRLEEASENIRSLINEIEEIKM